MIPVRHIIPLIILCALLVTPFSAPAAKQTDIRKIPVAKGLASHPVNGGHCLISDGELQYIAFYDGDHQLTIGKRKLSETKWDFAKLPERVGWDTHNKILIFQDRKGHLHRDRQHALRTLKVLSHESSRRYPYF